MKLVIQRVKNAAVTADGTLSGSIENGLLALLGVVEGDTEEQAQYLAGKTARLRIFTDEDDKLNLSVQDVKGSVLVVSNFTLAGDCQKGNRPSFDRAAKQPDSGRALSEIRRIPSGTGDPGGDRRVRRSHGN